MRGQDCKRKHSAQGNAGYIYTKRKDERSKKSKRCVEREFVEVLIFPSKRSSNNACRRFWFRDRLQTQIYYEVQTVFGHVIPKNIKLS